MGAGHLSKIKQGMLPQAIDEVINEINIFINNIFKK